MKHVIASSLFTVALDATFALYGLRASTFVVAAVRMACKTAGVAPKALSVDELKAHVASAIAYITGKGCPPCTKEGAPLSATKLSDFVRDAVRTLDGSGAKRKQAAKGAKQAKGGADDMNDDSADAAPPKTPATFPNSDVLAKIRTLCALCATSKDKNAKALASVVAEFFA